ncbi:39S ribosomal protein L51, mitochondrial [Bombina bombina]|uniref:39S ribosomal protein L51, mitochondrial n=1 Tax=Bombina bombina TaxID=8345 RepID=UPI00235A7E6A|nr:39S ribosomal protein L51, mitochondrial [Bombina bombina]XP_053548824.1 39S ribosomal protein L51, mitochondrial [Bombina bombina]
MWPISQLLGRSCHVFPLPSLTTRTFSLGQWSLIRMNFLPKPKTSDRWDNKRAMFGVYDNIGILGDFKAHPRELIIAPSWLKGWKGNELQRCIRKRQMVGARMFYHDRENLNKRIRFLYKRFNRYGKHR